MIEKLRELGLDLDIWEPSFSKMKDHPYFVSPRTSFADSPNIVATLKEAATEIYDIKWAY